MNNGPKYTVDDHRCYQVGLGTPSRKGGDASSRETRENKGYVETYVPYKWGTCTLQAAAGVRWLLLAGVHSFQRRKVLFKKALIVPARRGWVVLEWSCVILVAFA